MIKLNLDASIYSKEALLKACYAFLDRYYFHLALKDGEYLVEITLKESTDEEDNIKNKFENELLAQTVRISIANKTKNIRELLMARAMASTIIDEQNQFSDNGSIAHPDSVLEDLDNDQELKNILQDWFKVNE